MSGEKRTIQAEWQGSICWWLAVMKGLKARHAEATMSKVTRISVMRGLTDGAKEHLILSLYIFRELSV